MCARWYICNSAILPHGSNRHSERLPQYADMFMDLNLETIHEGEKKRERGSKWKTEQADEGGDDNNAAVER